MRWAMFALLDRLNPFVFSGLRPAVHSTLCTRHWIARPYDTPSGSNHLGLDLAFRAPRLQLEIDQFRALGDLIADGAAETLEFPHSRRADRMLHLHGFHDEQRRAFLDRARLGKERDDPSRHRRSKPALGAGPFAGLIQRIDRREVMTASIKEHMTLLARYDHCRREPPPAQLGPQRAVRGKLAARLSRHAIHVKKIEAARRIGHANSLFLSS